MKTNVCIETKVSVALFNMPALIIVELRNNRLNCDVFLVPDFITCSDIGKR